MAFTSIPCWHRRTYFTCSRAAGVYDGPLREAIHALKFGRHQAMGGPLGRLIAEVVTTDSRQVDLVVPFPLHPARLRDRRFNQAELLAAEVADHLNVPLNPRVLQRARATPPQTGLGRAERRANVRRAFVVREPLKVASVLLVDDVKSTGSTGMECARILRQSGARRVVVATVALAVLDY